MATNIHTQTLLTLPLELRNIIYSELLSSKRSEPITLYDDSKGREIHSNLCPSILRTNKQIYEEAICHLYNMNTFLLKLDHKRRILPLFRSNRTPPTDVSTEGEYDDRPRKLVPIRISAQQSTKDFIKTIAGTSRRFQVQGQYIRMFCAA